MSSEIRVARRVAGSGETVFAEMTALARKHGTINLGQGFPDFAAPAFVKAAAQKAIAQDVNQYAPDRGLLVLREALAAKYALHEGRRIDPDREVTVTAGATEGIFAAMMGLIDPGDEVILFEPYYDSYVPAVRFAGGVPRFCTLRPPSWEIDEGVLRGLFNERTKLVVVNTPHNPTGKVFDEGELALIGELCVEWGVTAVVDAVYEHILFDGAVYCPLTAVAGMAERTVTISSVGKTFSVTGWKVGWAVGPAPLVEAVTLAHQFITFCAAAPLQAATAESLNLAAQNGYYETLRELYEAKRDFLMMALNEAGLPAIKPAGTYFVMVDISGLGFADDVAFCRYLTREVGVAAIPPSAFYENRKDGATVARFAFCKTDEALGEAAVRLKRGLGK